MLGYLHLQCFCSEPSDIVGDPNSTGCTFACAGDSSETCGGNNAISVYQAGTIMPMTVEALTLVDKRTETVSLGCFADTTTARIMTFEFMDSAMTTAASIFLGCFLVCFRGDSKKQGSIGDTNMKQKHSNLIGFVTRT